MGMQDNSRCINCERAVDGPAQKFCPSCGQPTPVHRIDWHFLGHELEHSVLHMDRGILYSLKQLMLHPGTLLRDYIDGRRANQVKPLLMVMVMSALVVLLTRWFIGGGVTESMLPAGTAEAAQANAHASAGMRRLVEVSSVVARWMNTHFAAFTVILLPVEAAVNWLVFRRFSRLNYPEWLVIKTFLMVQVFVIWVLLVPFHRWISPVTSWVVVLGMLYGVWSLLQFFRGRPVWSVVWRTALSYALFVLVSQLVTVIIIAVVMLTTPG